MYRVLLAIGVAIQVFAMLSIKVDTPLSWQAGWLTLSFASLIGIGFVVAAGIKAGPRPVFRTFAYAGSVAGAIGWASWILVALTSEKGRPGYQCHWHALRGQLGAHLLRGPGPGIRAGAEKSDVAAHLGLAVYPSHCRY